MRQYTKLLLSALGAVLAVGACRPPRVEVSHPAIPVDGGSLGGLPNDDTHAIQLASDVVLPVDRPAGGAPTVLIQTRYWRSFRMRGGGGPKIPQGPREGIVARLVNAGFAVVITDVRGTGASDGVWRWPWSDEEVRDMGAVIDWIVAQPWSNGAVGTTGVSYEGTTALLAAVADRPALKAVLARQIEWNLVDETIAPGGVRNALFADTWGRAVDDLDHGRYPSLFPSYAKWFVTGVTRRDDDPHGTRQKARQAARASSDISARARGVRRGADPFGANAPATDSLGPAGHTAQLARTRAVVGIWGSWWDGATADAVFRAQQAMPIAQAIIGPWNHEGDENASPLGNTSSDRPTVELDSVVAFFTHHVRATPVLPDSTRRVQWYVAGTEAWRSAAAWPLTHERRWPLMTAATDSSLHWRSSITASTGENNRWTTGLARSVDIADRANARGLRAFVLPALTDSLTVFGAGSFDCRLQADHPEATLHVYVESVSPSGRVRLLTEGMQRVTFPSAPSWADVSIRIRPVAFALPSGWRVRVSLANEDQPTFVRVPVSGPVAWTLDTRACTLALPSVN